VRFRPGVQHVRKCLGLVVTLTSAAGCAPVPDRAAHTVEEYREDARLRAATVSRCANDQSNTSLPDCVNALKAERLEGVGSLRTLPALEIPSPAATTDSTPQDLRRK
jgi:hypothetical protein